ncbi:MAG: hypothetical protein JO212_14715 [Acetobacteraceae bacterium]|nr:hypothetical protein [Acetobacteraceae bacterium]
MRRWEGNNPVDAPIGPIAHHPAGVVLSVPEVAFGIDRGTVRNAGRLGCGDYPLAAQLPGIRIDS